MKRAHHATGTELPEHTVSAARIVHRAQVAAVATGPVNMVLACNGLFCELVGRSDVQLVGRNLQDVLDARDIFGNRLDRAHGAFHDMFRRFESLQSFKMDVLDASGVYRRVAVSIIVVLEPEPTGYSLVYLLTPIHRRRRADQLIDQILAGIGVGDTGSYVGEGARGAGDAYQLTGRQKEVLQLLAEGRKAIEISDELCVSVNTVRSHIRSIFQTLEVSSQLEAVAKALALRLI